MRQRRRLQHAAAAAGQAHERTAGEVAALDGIATKVLARLGS